MQPEDAINLWFFELFSDPRVGFHAQKKRINALFWGKQCVTPQPGL
ncbi:MAG: hypothetical protein ACI868_000252 [Granulosicoccus sp.]